MYLGALPLRECNAPKRPKDITTLKKQRQSGKGTLAIGILRPKCLKHPHTFRPRSVKGYTILDYIVLEASVTISKVFYYPKPLKTRSESRYDAPYKSIRVCQWRPGLLKILD